MDRENCQLLQKYWMAIFRTGQSFKNFRFNYVLDQKTNQGEVYNSLHIDVYSYDNCRILLNKLLMDIRLPFSHMDRQEVERLIQWQEFRINSVRMYSNLMIVMGSSHELSKIYGNSINYCRKYSQTKSDKYSVKASFT